MDFFDQDGFSLEAGISAERVAQMERRIRFLEAALVQVLRDDTALKEWFSAAELISFDLPGLPRTPSGLARHAKQHEWESCIVQGAHGERRLYHFSSLPRRAFEEMLERVLRNPIADASMAAMVPDVPVVPRRPGRPQGELTPQWLLPLMRLLKKETLPVGEAVLRLPVDEQTGRRPQVGEVVRELQKLGMMGR